MKTTNERIFAKDTDMMFWQQDNCTQCAKAVWYNARLGRCPSTIAHCNATWKRKRAAKWKSTKGRSGCCMA